MRLEHVRTGVSLVWLFTALFIADELQVSWKTSPLFLALGLSLPVVLFILWDHPLPAIGRRSKDPRL